MSAPNHVSRWLRLAACSAALLFSGILYSWSVISFPFADMGFSAAALKLNYTITMCAFCLGGFVSGLLAKRIRPTLRTLAAALLVLGGFLLASCTMPESIAWLYLGYGVGIGGGIGIVYNVVIASMNAWFPDKKGICTGIMMMAFGFTTLLIGTPMAALMENLGWRFVYRWYGIILFVILVLTAFAAVPPKTAVKAAAANETDMTASQMVRRGSFWMLFVFFTLFAAVGSTAISGAKGQFGDLGCKNASLLAGILTVANGLGRIVSGAYFDTKGLRKTQYLTSIVVIAACLLTFLGYALHITALGAAGLLLCGFSYGFSPTVSAAFVGAFYGRSHFGLNFSILNLVLIPASFVPTLLAGAGGTVTFLVLLAASAAGLILNINIRKA